MKDSSQNLFSENLQGLDSMIPMTIDLLMSGMQWLKALSGKEYEIRFSQWATLIRKARGNAKGMTLNQLEWLWEAITSEPGIHNFLGNRIISLEEEWKESNPVKCVSAKSRFGIFLKNFHAYGTSVLSLPADIKPDAEAFILDALYKKPGKARHLVCCDVAASLEIRPDKFGPKNVEAAALKMAVDDVTIKEGCIYVNVKSLNHAYTTASPRLEPHRRSHGGRVYDHVALKTENGYVPLETIRNKHEAKFWNALLKEEKVSD